MKTIEQISIQVLWPFLISFFIQFIFIKISSKKLFCIDNSESKKPQKFHEVPTPRAGGFGIIVGFLLSCFWCKFLNEPWVLYGACIIANKSGDNAWFMGMSVLPAFIAGFYEDVSENLSPKLRMIIIAFGAFMGVILMDAIVFNIGFGKMPLWFAIFFTVVAVTGISNSINIIDGFNGLASGVSVIILLSFAFIAAIHGDQVMFSISIILMAAIMGFFVWNFPKGKIFLGDGGAYFIGFLLAEISVLLVRRNPEVSPWFPVVALSYPIFEVFFSIYRKKFKRGNSAFEPDKVHLHMLIYRRITKSNPKTSVYIWPLVVVFNLLAILFYAKTIILILTFILFAGVYIFFYRRIVKFGWTNGKVYKEDVEEH